MRPCLTIVVLFGCAASVTAEPPTLSPTKGVVLLRNGQVLSGTITRTGDYYHVSKPGTDIRLKAGEVDKVAASLTDLYAVKRGRITPDKLADRLNLSEWCIEQRLMEEAKAELTAAAKIEPNHPRIALLQRRIELAGRKDEPAEVPPPAIPTGPSNEELDRLVRGLPASAVEAFTSTIQPLLVNNCTTSGCHGPRSPGKLHLLRLSLSGPANRRLTQRNLHAVWQTIDVNQPSSSPLLTQPIRPHGKAKGPIFSGHEAAQYRQLVSWVYVVARQRKPEPPLSDVEESRVAASAANKKAASLPADKKKRKGKPQEVARAVPSEPALDVPPPTDESEESAAVPPSDEADEVTAPDDPQPTLDNDEEYQPVDPFDPEIFNRRILRR